LSYIPGGLVALLFDQQFGLLAAAPVLAAALVVVPWRGGSNGAAEPVRVNRLVWSLVSAAFAYFAAVGVYWMWWGGVPATPARFSAAALPLLAIPLAVAWARAGMLRPFLRALLGISVALSALLLATDRGSLLWNYRQTMRAAWLDWSGVVANVPRGLPSFFWGLDPGHVRSEIGFGIHAALTVAVIVAIGLLAAFVVRRVRADAATAASWWVAIAAMAAVQCGWSLNGSQPLNASSSQLRVLDGFAGGRRAIEIRPWAAWTSLRGAPQLHVRVTPETGTGSEVVWAFEDVPAGQYRLEALPQAGRATVRIGKFDVASVPLASGTREFGLPAGARALSITGEGVDRLELVPVALSSLTNARAVALAGYGDWRVYFFDGNVFVESDGFWVRGGETTSFVVSGSGTTATLELANGAMSNAVSFDAGGHPQTLTLQPSESRVITAPLDAGGSVRVTIASPAGFRPSDIGAGADRRYLGVRVMLR
jgi:hypothetical protein